METLSTSAEGSTDDSKYKPKPNDFDLFVPWACNQLELDAAVTITRLQQSEYVSITASDRSKSKRNKGRTLQSLADRANVPDKDENSQCLLTATGTNKTVRICTVYDCNDHLVQPHLTSLVINEGLNKYTMCELHNILPISCITELCLDDTYLAEANYYILLETTNSLKHLSLARCKLGDIGIEAIARNLIYPTPASKTLSALNLSTNRITDLGATYLAKALRSNRQLSYLNLANNMITDVGATYIFDHLKEFALESEELVATQSRHMHYLIQRREIVEKFLKELKSIEIERRKTVRRKSKLPPVSVLKKIRAGETDVIIPDSAKEYRISVMNMESILIDKAVLLAENTMGAFDDPFSEPNTFAKDEMMHCYGNNTLCYLNMAYNNLTYISAKKLLKILVFQKLVSRKPIGLTNVIIEGNYLPAQCLELTKIDESLDVGLMMHTKTASAKKKPQSKFSVR